MSATDPDGSELQSPLALGTFVGVFTPTVLTILGVIMYLRLGWVVGNAGLYGALGIVLFSHLITVLTSLSLSALATNMRVGVGGAYFLISRTLGLEVGGAIGIPLYVCQALSVTLYCYGFAEVVLGLVPWLPLPVPIAAALTVLGVGAVAAKSTELTLRLQLPIMALIFASILSLFFGATWGGSVVDSVGPWTDVGFWGAFAVFFPAVTGVLAGVSLSGDLADPGRSIPRGVLSAVAVGLVVYMLVPFALAGSASGAVLRSESNVVWYQIAWVPALVLPGMVGAILSSAFGSILGAPRTLQALAFDRLLPRRLAEIDPETGAPVLALRLTTGLALVATLLGDLNAVATVLTMFFLTTYGTLNLVASVETLTGDPSFRPRIRIPAWASMLGAVGCLVAMFAISPVAGLAAIVIEAALFTYLRRRAIESTWGDVRGGALLSSVRYALLRLRDVKVDPRNWRPHILVFTTDAARSLDAIDLAATFSRHRGIVTVVRLVVGDLEDRSRLHAIDQGQRALLDERRILAFPEVVAVDDVDAGMLTVAQANGFAGLDSNTVLFGWPHESSGLGDLLRLTRKLAWLGKCTVIYRCGDAPPTPPGGRRLLLVWWKGLEHNGDLMLLLAHLMTQDRRWRDARIVLKSLVDDEAAAQERRREFHDMLPAIRIEAEVDVLVRDPEVPIDDVIRGHSRGAAMVFLGLRLPDAGTEEDYAERLRQVTDGLPPTVLVRNGGPFRGRLV